MFWSSFPQTSDGHMRSTDREHFRQPDLKEHVSTSLLTTQEDPSCEKIFLKFSLDTIQQIMNNSQNKESSNIQVPMFLISEGRINYL